MSVNLYPQTLQEGIALLGALTPFIGLAGGALWRAWTYAREQRQKEWERLHELVKTLYNKDTEYGLWGQLVAIHELKTLRIDRAILAAIVSNMLKFWTDPKLKGDPKLISELENALKCLKASSPLPPDSLSPNPA
jgi:hypothetical protein